MSTRPEILVTDTLFIQRSHERRLEGAGFKVIRLPKAHASEAELCRVIKGRVGYILGGIETVTSPVIEAADQLRAIVFTGSDYHPFIPALQEARDRGIVIGHTPLGPMQAVAEWMLSAALLMNRRLLEYAIPSQGMIVVPGLEGRCMGIIGYGNIGKRLAEMLVPFRPASIFVSSRHSIPEAQNSLVRESSLEDMLKKADVLFLCISETGNQSWFNVEKLMLLKPECLLVSVAHRGVIEEDSLYEAVASGRLRAALDQDVHPRFQSLPVSHWFCMNGSFAFCTQSEIELVSSMAVEKIIELLK